MVWGPARRPVLFLGDFSLLLPMLVAVTHEGVEALVRP
jgi:hypothetical protein